MAELDHITEAKSTKRIPQEEGREISLSELERITVVVTNTTTDITRNFVLMRKGRLAKEMSPQVLDWYDRAILS